MGGEKNICLFLVSGRTFTFKDITITCDNETTLAFKYIAMSDGRTKYFTGRKDALAGYSIWEN